MLCVTVTLAVCCRGASASCREVVALPDVDVGVRRAEMKAKVKAEVLASGCSLPCSSDLYMRKDISATTSPCISRLSGKGRMTA